MQGDGRHKGVAALTGAARACDRDPFAAAPLMPLGQQAGDLAGQVVSRAPHGCEEMPCSHVLPYAQYLALVALVGGDTRRGDNVYMTLVQPGQPIRRSALGNRHDIVA